MKLPLHFFKSNFKLKQFELLFVLNALHLRKTMWANSADNNTSFDHQTPRTLKEYF